MERLISEYLLGQEIELLTVGAGKFSGIAQRVESGVLTLEWEERKTFIACEQIVAIWQKSDKDRPAPSLGFGAR